MSEGLLTSLGLGAVLGYLALPLLSWAARRTPMADAQSRQGPLLLALAAANGVWLLAVLAPSPSAPMAAALDRAVIATGATRPLELTEGTRLSPLAIVGALWALLVVAAALRTLSSLLRIRSMVHAAQPAPEALQLLADRVADELLVPRAKVGLSSSVPVPLLAPGRRPRILLPDRLARTLGAGRLELVLRHELTHLARGDHRVAGLVALLRLPFVLHPSARVLDFDLALAREEAVDARVGAPDPGTYARLLLEVAESMPKRRLGAPVPTMGDTALAHRVGSLLEPRPLPLARVAPVLLIAALTLAGAGYSGGVMRSAGYELPRLTLAVGQEHLLSIPGLERVVVPDPTVVDVTSQGDERVLVRGLGRGRTQVSFWSKGSFTRQRLSIEVGEGAKASASPP